MSDSCIFCKIIKGEIPSYEVYEDEEFLGFLDISQIVDGHTLLIPKKHVRWVWDIENIGEYYEVAKKIVKKMQQVTGKESVVSVTVGEMIEHAHLHLLPDSEGNKEMVLEAWDKALKARKKSGDEMGKIRERFELK